MNFTVHDSAVPAALRLAPQSPDAAAQPRAARADASRVLRSLTALQHELALEVIPAEQAQLAIDAATALTRAELGVLVYQGVDPGGQPRWSLAWSGVASTARAALQPTAAQSWLAERLHAGDSAAQVAPDLDTSTDLLCSCLAVPIVGPEGEARGTLFLTQRGRDVFDEQDETVLAHVAAQATASLALAHSMDEWRRERRERIRIEAITRAGEDHWRQLGDSIPQIVWIAMPGVGCLYVNERWREYTGKDPGSALGRVWLDSVHPDDLEDLKAGLQSLQRNGKLQIEYRLRRHDGDYRWFLTRGTATRDSDDKVTRLYGTCTDIEDVKRAQHALLENERALEEAMRHKDEFLAMLGHELRNPLSAVRNAVELQRLLDIAEPHFQRTRNVIDRQSKHMTRLIDELLDVARIARGKVHLEKQPVDLSMLLRIVVDDSANLIKQHGLDLALELAKQGPMWVDGDQTRLTQVMQNLLDNAAKFTDRGGKIVLRLELDDARREAVVRVRDNGIGMDREMLARIFDPFRQADRTLDRARGGLGLGLALVRGLIDLHGGSASASSAGIGLGTEVTLRLPLTTELHASVTPVSGTHPRLPSLRVVVIEDNHDSADTLRDVLHLAGYEVQLAYDGEAGLAVVHEFDPDIVLCDIGLPGALSGYEVARALRGRSTARSPYLVAVTGYGRAGDRERALAAGFDRHLTKPVNLAQIHQIATERDAVQSAGSV